MKKYTPPIAVVADFSTLLTDDEAARRAHEVLIELSRYIEQSEAMPEEKLEYTKILVQRAIWYLVRSTRIINLSAREYGLLMEIKNSNAGGIYITDRDIHIRRLAFSRLYFRGLVNRTRTQTQAMYYLTDYGEKAVIDYEATIKSENTQERYYEQATKGFALPKTHRTEYVESDEPATERTVRLSPGRARRNKGD